jgi:hypothetical protein
MGIPAGPQRETGIRIKMLGAWKVGKELHVDPLIFLDSNLDIGAAHQNWR